MGSSQAPSQSGERPQLSCLASNRSSRTRGRSRSRSRSRRRSSRSRSSRSSRSCRRSSRSNRSRSKNSRSRRSSRARYLDSSSPSVVCRRVDRLTWKNGQQCPVEKIKCRGGRSQSSEPSVIRHRRHPGETVETVAGRRDCPHCPGLASPRHTLLSRSVVEESIFLQYTRNPRVSGRQRRQKEGDTPSECSPTCGHRTRGRTHTLPCRMFLDIRGTRHQRNIHLVLDVPQSLDTRQEVFLSLGTQDTRRNQA